MGWNPGYLLKSFLLYLDECTESCCFGGPVSTLVFHISVFTKYLQVRKLKKYKSQDIQILEQLKTFSIKDFGVLNLYVIFRLKTQISLKKPVAQKCEFRNDFTPSCRVSQNLMSQSPVQFRFLSIKMGLLYILIFSVKKFRFRFKKLPTVINVVTVCFMFERNLQTNSKFLKVHSL